MEQTNTTAAVAGTPVVKDIQNGITRPKAGTTCGRVWDICNTLSEAENAPAERAKVIAQATGEGINAATVATQHGKWRKYHGLTSANTPEAKAEAEKEKAAVKEQKAAAAALKKEAAALAKRAKALAKQAKAAVAVPPASTSDVSVETGEAAQ